MIIIKHSWKHFVNSIQVTLRVFSRSEVSVCSRAVGNRSSLGFLGSQLLLGHAEMSYSHFLQVTCHITNWRTFYIQPDQCELIPQLRFPLCTALGAGNAGFLRFGVLELYLWSQKTGKVRKIIFIPRAFQNDTLPFPSTARKPCQWKPWLFWQMGKLRPRALKLLIQGCIDNGRARIKIRFPVFSLLTPDFFFLLPSHKFISNIVFSIQLVFPDKGCYQEGVGSILLVNPDL